MCSRLPLTPVLIICSPGVHEARASPSTESQATIRSHLVIGNVCLFLGTGATQGPRGRNCMAKRPRSPPGEPMTLGNMRPNGVRSLDVVVLAVPPPCDLERGPVARSRPVRKQSPPPFQTHSQIGNVIKELPAGPAVVPPINGSVCAVGRHAF
jgi:hypothetical protein